MNKLAQYGLAVFLLLGFNAACSKQLLPPDVESGSGSGMTSSFDSGSGSSGSGISGGDVNDDGSTGTPASDGDPGAGFNITGENEGTRPNDGGFTDSNVGDGSGSMGSGNHGDMNFGSNDQGFGTADKFNHGTDSNGAFGFGGGSGGSSDGSGGSSGGMAGGSGGQFGSGDGNAMAGSGGRMGGHEEARLLTFKPSADLQDVHFEFDKYDLDENTKEVLKANAEWLKKNPAARVEIQGHCDERGTNNYNLGLGERRAISTKKYLMALGVDETRLFTISYGEEKPFCFESSENCWLENRRAHFMVAQ